MKDRGQVIGQVDRNQENSKDLEKPRVRRVTVINQKTKPSQGSQSIAGPLTQGIQAGKPPTEGSRTKEVDNTDKARGDKDN
ncbi:hypothetical protein TNCV_1669391 [Trichonephila clavipes]|nr:hypothetical protein TNCV_1669391 [Trichonephila clavipes]